MSFASHILHTQQGIRGLRHANPPYRNGGSRLRKANMPFSIRKTIPVTRSARVNVSKRGASMSKTAGRVTANTRGRGRVRVAKGLSFRFKLW